MPENVRLLCHSLPPTDKGADFPYGFDLLLLRLSKINSEVSTLFCSTNAVYLQEMSDV